METLNVDLGERSYPIFIGSDLFDKVSLSEYVTSSQVMVVTNTTVAPLYLQALKCHLGGQNVSEVVLPDGEVYKTVEHLQRIFDALLHNKHNRTTTIIALGGGVVGDMAGFAAACYQRGVHFIQIPTTLLSQVDSSVGGKTGVNHPAGKNMIGAFHQPQAVFIDIDKLQTLPERELAAGLAEVVKYGLIYDASFFAWLEEQADALMAKQPDALIYAIKRSCEIKAAIVSQDETERGIRAHLNLGHTFGHAIETFTGYSQWLHGEAVSAGTVLAAELSCKLGWLPVENVARIVRLLKRFNLPIKAPTNMTTDDFLQRMSVDKKVVDGQLKLVLLQSLGCATITSDFSHQALLDTLQGVELNKNVN